jgi:hypothetical protein
MDYVSRSLVSEYLKAEKIKPGVQQLLFHWYAWLPARFGIDGSVTELPPKIPHYASLFVVANARKQVIGKDTLDFTVGKIKELIETGDLVRAKLMLRFLAGLTRIVEENGVMDIIGEIVSKIETEAPNVFSHQGEQLMVGENG